MDASFGAKVANYFGALAGNPADERLHRLWRTTATLVAKAVPAFLQSEAPKLSFL